MDKQPNKDYMLQSLGNQVAEMSVKLAERDAYITELYQELQQYREKEIEEMDGQSDAK